jgi:hypothetical protein
MKPFHQFIIADRELNCRAQTSQRLFFFFAVAQTPISISTNLRVVSFFVRRRQFLLVCIDHAHGEQLRGFGVARILINGWLILACSRSGLARRSGAVKPVLETGGTKQRVLTRDEAPLLKRRAEVASLLVPHDRA